MLRCGIKLLQILSLLFDNLPEKQQVRFGGRANKYAAAAYLAKVIYIKAYRRRMKIWSFNFNWRDDLEEVVKYNGEVLVSNCLKQISLTILCQFENGKESIFLPFTF